MQRQHEQAGQLVLEWTTRQTDTDGPVRNIMVKRIRRPPAPDKVIIRAGALDRLVNVIRG